MKVGDTVPVTLAGDVVAQAKITAMEEGIATLEFPGTRVQMSYVTQLTPEAPAAPAEPSKQTIITGVDRVDGEGNIIDSSNAVAVPPVESAPVVENVENTETVETPVDTETPTGESTQTQLVEAAVPVED